MRTELALTVSGNLNAIATEGGKTVSVDYCYWSCYCYYSSPTRRMKAELSDERTEYIDYIESSTLMGLRVDQKVQGWVFEEEVNEENNRYLKY